MTEIVGIAHHGDDMLIVPSLDPLDPTSAAARARVQRRTSKQREAGGLWQRLRRAQVARKLSRLATVRGATRAGMGFTGASRIASTASTAGSAVRAAANPLVLGVATVAVAAIVAARVFADRPFEGIGQELNETLLGDLDDDARAAMSVRGDLERDPVLMRALAEKGSFATQMKQVFADRQAIEKSRQRGESFLAQEFPVNGMLDMIALRIWEAIRKAVGKHHLGERFERAQEAFQVYQTRTMRDPNVLSRDRKNRGSAR